MTSQKRAARLLERVARPLDMLATVVASVLMGTLTVLVIVQVIARYVFNSSFDLVLEVPRISFILVIYLAMPLAYRDGMHVGMSILPWFVPKKYIPMIARITCVIMIGVILLIISLAFDMMIQTWEQYLPSIQFPIGGFYAAVVFGSVHLLLHVFRSLVVGDFGQSAVMSE